MIASWPLLSKGSRLILFKKCNSELQKTEHLEVMIIKIVAYTE